MSDRLRITTEKGGQIACSRPFQDSRERVPLAVFGLAGLILVTIGRVQEFVPGIKGLPLAKILFLLLGISLLPSASWNRDLSYPQVKSFVFLFVIGCVSTAFSLWRSQSMEFMRITFLSLGLFLFFLIRFCNSWQSLKILIWTMMASAVISSCTTLFLNSDMGRAAIAGTSNDPNDLAFALVIFLPFFYFAGKAVESRLAKILLIMGAISTFAAILSTQSRGGFIGLLVVSGATLLHERIRPMRVLLIGVGILILIMFLSPAQFWDRMSMIGNKEQDYNMTAETGRIAVWKRGIGFMLSNPILGVGPDVFPVADGESHGGGGKWSTAHNSFILIGAEFGIPGLLLFLSMIFKSLQAVSSASHKLPTGSTQEGLITAIRIGFYGYLVSGFFLSQAYSPILILLVGLSIVVTKLTAGSN